MDDTGAGISCRRTLTWAQTDAAGHNHFTALFAWLEEAEHALWRALGQVAEVDVVHAPERARPWPDDVRAALLAPRRYREGAVASTVGGHS